MPKYKVNEDVFCTFFQERCTITKIMYSESVLYGVKFTDGSQSAMEEHELKALSMKIHPLGITIMGYEEHIKPMPALYFMSVWKEFNK